MKSLLRFLFLAAFLMIIGSFIVFNDPVEKNLLKASIKTGITTNAGISETPAEHSFSDVPFYRDIVLTGISLDGDPSIYSLKNGEAFRGDARLDAIKDGKKIDEILRLSLFYQWMAEDPLMFSPFADLMKMRASLEHLDEMQNKFLSKSAQWEWPAPIFATGFLKQFIETSEEYKNFSNNISYNNARALLAEIQKTNDVYLENAGKFFDAVAPLARENPNAKMFFSSGPFFTSPQIILDDLEKIKTNGQAISAELEKRKKCLESFDSCERPMESFSAPTATEIREKKAAPVFLSKQELGLKNDIAYFGPYEINSKCWENKTDGISQFLYLSFEKYGDRMMLHPHLATNTYFWIMLGNTPFEKNLLGQGVKALGQSVTTPYTCANLEYYPNIAAVDFFFRNFNNDRLIANQNTKEAVAESSFFDTKYPSQNALDSLANSYASVYAVLSKNGSNDDNKKELLKRYLMAKEKLMYFELTLNNLAKYMENVVLNASMAAAAPDGEIKSSFPIYPPLYMYTSRSAHSLLFLNFNSFIWRIEQKPDYFSEIPPDDRQKSSERGGGFVDFQTAEKLYGRETILKWRSEYDQDDKYEFYENYKF